MLTRFVKWWLVCQVVLGAAWGIPLGIWVTTLPQACKTAALGARSAEGLLSALGACPEAAWIVGYLH